MPAVVDIANQALTLVGELSTIADVDKDTTPAARAFRRCYEATRDVTLASADWGFAHVMAQPTAMTLTAKPAAWTFAFRYPVDCLAFRGVFPWPMASQPLPAELVSLPLDDGSGYVRAILCNASQPTLVYTRRVLDPTDFSPPFVECLVWRLCISLAMALGRSLEIQQRAEQMFEKRLSEAIAASMGEQPRPAEPDSPMITGRDGPATPFLPGDDPSMWLGWRTDDIRRA